jgi:hypothetical protein
MDIKPHLAHNLRLPSEISQLENIPAEDVRLWLRDNLPYHFSNNKLDWGALLSEDYLTKHSELTTRELATELGCGTRTILRYRSNPSNDNIWRANRNHAIGTIFSSPSGDFAIMDFDKIHTRAQTYFIKFLTSGNQQFVSRKNIDLGKVTAAKVAPHVGNVYESNKCGAYEITAVLSLTQVKIKFLKTQYERIARTEHLRTGEVRDPYYPRIHGIACMGAETDKAYYARWHGMISRCHVPTNRQFSNYGGRGITVCNAWLCYETYCNDLHGLPNHGLNGFNSIDRINNDDGYNPSNCRWANPTMQTANQWRIGNDPVADKELLKALLSAYEE